MQSLNRDSLFHEWQEKVKEYSVFRREGRLSGLTREELDELSRPYLTRIDEAYSLLKRAERLSA
jgi:hypothetical protein